MHITAVLPKNYSFHNFLNKSNFVFVSFQKQFFHLKKCLSCLCLCHGVFLNIKSYVFAYLFIIFLWHNRFGFFLINEDALDPLRNKILGRWLHLVLIKNLASL